MRFGGLATQGAAIAVAIGCLLTGASTWAASGSSSDMEMTSWVREALRLDPRIDSMQIGIETDHGIVTLSGVVTTLAEKNYAVAEAKKISGVRGVVDDVLVSATLMPDQDILDYVKDRLASSSIVGPGVTAKAADGRITLSGWVNSWSEAEEARLLASEVPGVKAVQDDLEIRWRGMRADSEIRLDVLDALRRDVYLTGLPIEVGVNDGVVTLTGIVGSLMQRDRATRKAMLISNVNRVRNDLNVYPDEARGVRMASSFTTDAELLQALNDEIADDVRLSGADITPVASRGHVTLDGFVTSHYAKRIAEEDARDVVGVAWVTNDLLTRVDEREDELIQKDIDQKLDSDQLLRGGDIAASVKQGVVTLTGEVDRWYKRMHAADSVSKVIGVKDVIDRILVEQPFKATDIELVSQIKHRLAWDWITRPIEEGIRVDVKDNVATLTGVVTSWAERREAERVALATEGIWGVHDTLTVRGYSYRWDDWIDKLPNVSDPHYYGPLEDPVS